MQVEITIEPQNGSLGQRQSGDSVFSVVSLDGYAVEHMIGHHVGPGGIVGNGAVRHFDIAVVIQVMECTAVYDGAHKVGIGSDRILVVVVNRIVLKKNTSCGFGK